MSSIWGERLKISIFGESHGPAVGVVVDGFPSGLKLDFDLIATEMERRKPNLQNYSTKRQEADEVEVLSGIFEGFTTGTPITGLITNTDVRSVDYKAIQSLMRPGHADYSGHVRYQGFNDKRGGGHFSARLTAPLVFAGALAKQYLSNLGITVGAHIYRIKDIFDVGFDATEISKEQLDFLKEMDIPVNDRSCIAEMLSEIEQAKKSGDSIGGIVEAAVIGIHAGIGSPIFQNVESRIASILFSIPAVKGIEFGAGFSISQMNGSEANDSFYVDNNKVKTRTNHNGGINGGITNGMPVIVRAAFKPTPSISQEQDTVDISAMENAKIGIKGRHDACIVPRAVPVVEAALALAICDLILIQGS